MLRFLQLIDQHFPPSNKLHKIFNRHNVRISYSCLDNMSSFINRHNRKILNKHTRQTNVSNTENTRQCNCRQPNKCRAEGKHLTKSVVYQVEVTADNKPVKYIGVTADGFKTRFRNHAKSLANKQGRGLSINWGGYIFIYSCYARLICFEINPNDNRFQKKLVGRNTNI